MNTNQNNAPKASILVVDDTPANLRLLAGILAKQGYVVRPARNGDMALSSARSAPPDLILLDIMMPKMDGYQVCEQLKADEQTRDIPVIFISALNEILDKVKAFSAGGVDYITKPFQVPEVLARVKTHLVLRHLQKRLEEKNDALSTALEQLQAAQAQLVESEKMASLGGLVAGVAHEINTPIGIGVTAASTLANNTEILISSYKSGKLKGSALKTYLYTTGRSSELILNNLRRAHELVQSFKQVAVDRTTLDKRPFAVKEYLEETLLSLNPHIRQTKHDILVNGDEDIIIDSYPGAFSQIITNLIMNSINHAYPNGEAGQLFFNLSQKEKQLVIEYGDDGCGIPAENLSQIFEPFFTTARIRGGTGLGLHIVYNLITQTLNGTIRCESEVGYGTKFILVLPLDQQPESLIS